MDLIVVEVNMIKMHGMKYVILNELIKIVNLKKHLGWSL